MPIAEPTGPHIFARRRAALMARAAARGFDGVLAFGHGSALGAGSHSHGALRYLSGWDGHESAALLAITHQAAHLFVASPFMAPLARMQRSDLVLHDVRPQAWRSTLAGILPGPAATIGFGEMPAQIHATFAPHADAALDDEAARLRLVKDATELRHHRAAAALCDLLFGRLGDALLSRRPAWEIQLDLETLARRSGAEQCRTWLTIAPQADYCRYWPAETQQVPQAGDQVLFGVALTLDGHWGHGIRMGAIGPMTPEQRALADHVAAMLDAGLGAIRPGAPLAGIEAAIEGALADSGLATHPGLRRFRSGHGLGFSYEEPLLTEAFRQHFDQGAPPAAPPDIALAPGMLFELHPNLFVPGLGGAAIGEMVLVTPDGPDCLLATPRAPAVWT
ncbi:M24 family metallopeptidase [Aquabacter spiritensis]|uniref:Xaa-Pro aminopeptidase n=1 Tax=Aquabacter spiritensis TaxID=933073 RepID=A0A4R3M3Y7_9HYPH|nr:M24 family metallopeptidase [Aquabacter spiritensis]TCT07752.1 Xaa-Pro aminopeptidase [Aquabacter spiritensis]